MLVCHTNSVKNIVLSCETWLLLADTRTAQKVSRTVLGSQDSRLTPFEQFWLLLAGSTCHIMRHKSRASV